MEKITTRRVAKPKPPKPQAPEQIDIVQIPTTGRIVQVRIDPFDEEWRPAIVVAFKRYGERDDDWRATAEVFLAPGDIPFPNGTGMWLGDHGHCFFEVKPDNAGESVGEWRWPPRV